MNYFKSEAFRNAIFATLVVMAFSSMPSFAADATEATTAVKTIWISIVSILDLLVGIGGVVGIFIIVWKLKSGDEAAKGQIVMVLGGLTLWYLKYSILHLFHNTALG